MLECSLKDICKVSIDECPPCTYRPSVRCSLQVSMVMILSILMIVDPKQVRLHLTTSPTLDSVEVPLSTQKGVCRTHHITLTVDSEQEKILKKTLRARDIVRVHLLCSALIDKLIDVDAAGTGLHPSRPFCV